MTLDLTKGVTRAQLAETIFNSSLGDDFAPIVGYDMSRNKQIAITIFAYSLATLLGIFLVTFTIAWSSIVVPILSNPVCQILAGALGGAFGLMGLVYIVAVASLVVHRYLLKLSQNEAIKWLESVRTSLEKTNQEMNPSDRQEAFVTKPEGGSPWNNYYNACMNRIQGLLNSYPAQINN